MSGWEKSKLSLEVIRLDSPSTFIHCQIHKTLFDAFSNPVVGVNVMSKSFARTLLGNFQLTPATKLLKSLFGQILPSDGIFHLIPIKVDKTKVYLSFYVFDIWEFDLLIGHPIERLLHQGRKGSINVRLGKSINLSISITRSIHAKTELSPKQIPMEEIMAVSLLEAFDENFKEVTQDFIQDKRRTVRSFPSR
jgi:hypothetical protein